MLRIDPAALNDLARANGWLHTSGRLAGTINASRMADALGVAVSTVTRAYDGGAPGPVLLDRLRALPGASLDQLLESDIRR